MSTTYHHELNIDCTQEWLPASFIFTLTIHAVNMFLPQGIYLSDLKKKKKIRLTNIYKCKYQEPQVILL